MDALIRSSALELAELIRRGEISSKELTHLFLTQIHKHQDQLSAFALVTPERALKAAKKADRRRSKEGFKDLPIFHGIPSGIKDLVLTRGIRTQLGSRAYKYFVPPISAPIVARLEAGGLISCGKLATSELGVLPITETEVTPPARNPWDVSRTSGGSSGGSSAAIASGMLPLVQGSDGGGSVRIPAAYCYRYGFKPSLSLLGNLHGRVNRLGLSVMGPISLTVEDAAAMLDVMSPKAIDGHNPGPCLKASRLTPRPLRIRMLVQSSIGPVDPEFAAATRELAEKLQGLGHEVEEIVPLAASVEEFLPVWQYMVAQVPVLFESKLQPITRWIREAGKQVRYNDARAIQARYIQRFEEALGNADILLSPTVPGPAPLIGEFPQETPEDSFMRAALCGSLTAIFNLNLGPAASLPSGFTRQGLPIGIQIGGRPGQDHTLLALSRQIEEIAPWRDQWPALAGLS